MLNDYFKNKTVKNVTLIFLLAIAIYAFVEWREQRLERRAKMLPQETQLDLSQVGSEGRVEFLIDSHTGKQGVYIEVYTPVEVPKPKEITYTGKLAGKKTMTVNIYNKYEKSNPNKYKEWKDIELEILIRSKADGKIDMIKKCLPYDFLEDAKNSYLRSTCGLGTLYNGLYVANVKVLKNNVDFKENNSNINFSYPSIEMNDIDFFSSVFDSILRTYLGLVTD